jgi:hypothetical protein
MSLDTFLLYILDNMPLCINDDSLRDESFESNGNNIAFLISFLM